jgi:hypothetical protein
MNANETCYVWGQLVHSQTRMLTHLGCNQQLPGQQLGTHRDTCNKRNHTLGLGTALVACCGCCWCPR